MMSLVAADVEASALRHQSWKIVRLLDRAREVQITAIMMTPVVNREADVSSQHRCDRYNCTPRARSHPKHYSKPNDGCMFDDHRSPFGTSSLPNSWKRAHPGPRYERGNVASKRHRLVRILGSGVRKWTRPIMIRIQISVMNLNVMLVVEVRRNPSERR